MPWRREETGKLVERSATNPPFNMEDCEGEADLEEKVPFQVRCWRCRERTGWQY